MGRFAQATQLGSRVGTGLVALSILVGSTLSPAPAGAAPSVAGDWDHGTGPNGDGIKWDAAGGAWDPTLPMRASANVPDSPVAVINQVLGITSSSAQVTQQMGHDFLSSLGLAPSSGYTNGKIPRVYGKQASEYVIRRAMATIGTPYSWGGGTAAGPSRGIDDGANTVGFDCSGLIMYAFAGVGIRLPHYSGDQYQLGEHIPPNLAKRGDVIFYGPGGSQHVTLYLGQGKMLEAPYTGANVEISPVRTAGMTPYVVRYIDY